jgi:hypothetical protein
MDSARGRTHLQHSLLWPNIAEGPREAERYTTGAGAQLVMTDETTHGAARRAHCLTIGWSTYLLVPRARAEAKLEALLMSWTGRHRSGRAWIHSICRAVWCVGVANPGNARPRLCPSTIAVVKPSTLPSVHGMPRPFIQIQGRPCGLPDDALCHAGLVLRETGIASRARSALLLG